MARLIITVLFLSILFSNPLSARELRGSADFLRTGTIYAGILIDDGVDGVTGGFEFFQKYMPNLYVGGSIAYTYGEFVFFGGSDVEYFEITPSLRAYGILPPFRNTQFFLQGGISYNNIDHNNGENESGTGFKLGFGGVSGHREYLVMYNYIDMEGEDRKYITITLGFFFF